MHLFGLNRHRSETLLLLIGQLVLIAYVFQVAALDHWGAGATTDAANFAVVGVADSSAHAADHAGHCHGSPSTCADAGGGYAHFSPDQAFRLPAQAAYLVLDTDSSAPAPLEAGPSVIAEPPRASA